MQRENHSLGWSGTLGAGPRVLCTDGKGFTILTISIDPFMQGSPSTPQILASGKLCFFQWMDGWDPVA